MRQDGTGTSTVLFTDLVGSTSLRVRLGEEVADGLRRVHDELVGAAVVRHRGVVVKGGGDGLMAAFEAASDSVAAAVSMQQSLWSFNRKATDGVQLDVRVGLSVGDVSWESGDCFGLPVVEAARLQAAAAGGQIVCAELVELMARGRGGFEYRSLGELDLKGLASPIRACEVLWRPPATIGSATGYVPSLVRRNLAGLFVGRDSERAVLEAAFESASGGHPTVVLIGGEPGAGKTRLTSEITAGWVEQGRGLAVAGGCPPEVNLPYQPVIEALSQLVDIVGAEQVREWAGPDASTLTLAVPGVGASVAPGMRLGDRRDEFFRAVEAVFVGASAATTVVFVVDDLHWAPASTLALIRHLAGSPAVARLLVVVTYRDTAPDLTDPFRVFCADLSRAVDVVRLDLGGLTTADVVALLNESASRDAELDADRAARIMADTDGNAFFIAELVHAAPEARGSGVLAGSSARTVGEVVLQRVLRLGQTVVALLDMAAAYGPVFDTLEVAAAGGLEQGDMVEALSLAEQARLVRVAGSSRYAFRHELVRQALLTRCSSLQRAQLHERLLQVLESRNASASVLTHHATEALPLVDPQVAVRHARAAAAEAMDLWAPESTIEVLERLLERLPADHDRRRSELLLDIGRLYGSRQPGRDAVAEVGDTAKANGWTDLSIEAALVFGGASGGLWSVNRDRRGRELVEHALTLTNDPLTTARLLARRAAFALFNQPLEVRLAWTDTAKQFTDADTDSRLLAEIANNRVTAIECPVTADEVIDIGDFLVSTGRPREIANGMNHLEHGLFWAGQGRRLREVSTLEMERAGAGWGHLATSAVSRLYEGRIADAVRAHHLAVRDPQSDSNDVARGCNAFFAPLLAWLTGDGWAHATNLVDDAARRYKGALWQLTAAWIQAETGDHDQALQRVSAVKREEIRTLHTYYLGSHGIASLCHTALRLDRPDLTAEVYDLFGSLPEFMCGQNYSPYLAMPYYQGRLALRLGHRDEAAAHLDRATRHARPVRSTDLQPSHPDRVAPRGPTTHRPRPSSGRSPRRHRTRPPRAQRPPPPRLTEHQPPVSRWCPNRLNRSPSRARVIFGLPCCQRQKWFGPAVTALGCPVLLIASSTLLAVAPPDPRLRELYDRTQSVPATARELGVAYETARRWLLAAGVELRAKGRPSKAAAMLSITEITRRYAAGEGIAVIGHSFGVSPTTVRKRLIDAGVVLRPRSGWTY